MPEFNLHQDNASNWHTNQPKRGFHQQIQSGASWHTIRSMIIDSSDLFVPMSGKVLPTHTHKKTPVTLNGLCKTVCNNFAPVSIIAIETGSTVLLSWNYGSWENIALREYDTVHVATLRVYRIRARQMYSSDISSLWAFLYTTTKAHLLTTFKHYSLVLPWAQLSTRRGTYRPLWESI